MDFNNGKRFIEHLLFYYQGAGNQIILHRILS